MSRFGTRSSSVRWRPAGLFSTGARAPGGTDSPRIGPIESPRPEPARRSPHAARYVRHTLARHGRSRPAGSPAGKLLRAPRASSRLASAPACPAKQPPPSVRAPRRGARFGHGEGARRGHARRTARSRQFFGSRRSGTQIFGHRGQANGRARIVSLRFSSSPLLIERDGREALTAARGAARRPAAACG